jgi:hypothetical protein
MFDSMGWLFHVGNTHVVVDEAHATGIYRLVRWDDHASRIDGCALIQL